MAIHASLCAGTSRVIHHHISESHTWHHSQSLRTSTLRKSTCLQYIFPTRWSPYCIALLHAQPFHLVCVGLQLLCCDLLTHLLSLIATMINRLTLNLRGAPYQRGIDSHYDAVSTFIGLRGDSTHSLPASRSYSVISGRHDLSSNLEAYILEPITA